MRCFRYVNLSNSPQRKVLTLNAHLSLQHRDRGAERCAVRPRQPIRVRGGMAPC